MNKIKCIRMDDNSIHNRMKDEWQDDSVWIISLSMRGWRMNEWQDDYVWMITLRGWEDKECMNDMMTLWMIALSWRASRTETSLNYPVKTAIFFPTTHSFIILEFSTKNIWILLVLCFIHSSNEQICKLGGAIAQGV